MKAIVQAALVALLVATAGRAGAELRSAPDRPLFSEEDWQVIARNEALTSSLEENPWAVRRAVDAIKTLETETKGFQPQPRKPRGAQSSPPPEWDPQTNPDLDRLQRASAEAAHDLFQLLKKAGSQQTGAK